MTRWPRPGFAAQLAMLLGIALLIAQSLNVWLILNERQKASLARAEAPAIARFAATAADAQRTQADRIAALLDDRSQRGAYFDLRTHNDVAIPDDAPLMRQTMEALSATGASWRLLHVASQIPYPGMPKGDKPADPPGHHPDGPHGPPDSQILRFALQRADGSWLTARIYAPRRDPRLTLHLLAATAILYAMVLLPSLWIAARMTRPLRALTNAAQNFDPQGEPPMLPVSGPQDIARALGAFNAMSRRVTDLLDDKDRMLGAIGHDLRTPLASLRLRLEQMEPMDDRAAAVARIEEIAGMLDDMLTLARTGRARWHPERIDLAALAQAVVEDQIELGRPVKWRDAPRVLVMGHAPHLRRALANLVENAVTYAGHACVEVRTRGGWVELSVTDSGPGIAPGEIEAMLAPFHRHDPSRNRETAGSGLGLPIARSIAQIHGGRLELQSAKGGGLRAILLLPHAQGELP